MVPVLLGCERKNSVTCAKLKPDSCPVRDHVGYVRGEVLEVVHEEAARLATVGVIIVCGDESRAKARAEGV